MKENKKTMGGKKRRGKEYFCILLVWVEKEKKEKDVFFCLGKKWEKKN